MTQTRLEFALTRIQGTDWRAFEKFAADFLSVEYPNMRTTAAESGDGGRDAELYLPHEDPVTAIQVSVRKDWETKIHETLKRLSEKFPRITELIYVTNQPIGAAADNLKKSLRRDAAISLDVRDRQWFVERENTHAQRSVASERLAEAFVDPLLRTTGITPNATPKLSENDSRIALLQLALDVQDNTINRNLTKSCFESLVIAALRGTSAENRMSRTEIQTAIGSFVPAGTPGQLEALVDGALKRLCQKNGPVKNIRTSDEFQLSHGEFLRLKEQTTQFLLQEQQLENELSDRVIAMSGAPDGQPKENPLLGTSLRKALESVLFESSEKFASSITTGETVHLDANVLLCEMQGMSADLPTTAELATAAIQDVLAAPSIAMNAHLRRLSDSYTLFAFLKQTPDVQKVLLTVFSEGSIWLDTSAILPLIAETLIDAPDRRLYTQMFRAAVEAGLKMYVTPGVIEEVERHLNRCVAFGYNSNNQWSGSVPFIYSAYILSGRASSQFLSWQDAIRGKERALDDVRDYLDEVFSIKEKGLQDIAERAGSELRAAVQELWRGQHERRRGAADDYLMDQSNVDRLVNHDVENTVGVLELRRDERSHPMGYQSWWLTMDKTAFRIKSYLDDKLGQAAPTSSPALSPDFLSQYIRLGRFQVAVERNSHIPMPIITEMSRLENVPRSLIELSDNIRLENSELNERVLRRKVRDRMDTERTRRSTKSSSGISGLEDEIKDRIREEYS